MLFWWLTFSFAWTPATKILAKLLFTVIMARTTTDLAFQTHNNFSMVLSNIDTTKTPIQCDLIPGIYDYQSSRNFDNYLKALGVNSILRTLAGLASPIVTISTNCQENLSNVSIYGNYQ